MVGKVFVLMALVALPSAVALPLFTDGQGVAYVGPSPDAQNDPTPCSVRVLPAASGRACFVASPGAWVDVGIWDDSYAPVPGRVAFFDVNGVLVSSISFCSDTFLETPARAASAVVDAGISLDDCLGAATEGAIVYGEYIVARTDLF